MFRRPPPWPAQDHRACVADGVGKPPVQFMPHMPAGLAPQAHELSPKLFASTEDEEELCAANVENLRSTEGLPHPEHETGVAVLLRTNSSKLVPHWEQ